MSRIRNSLGKYAKALKDDIRDEINQKIEKETGFLYKEFDMRMPGLSIMNIFKFIFFLVIISPWIYICLRNGSFSSMMERIMSFYDDKFIITGVPSNSTSPQKPIPKTAF